MVNYLVKMAGITLHRKYLLQFISLAFHSLTSIYSVRGETKPLEHRSALTPTTTKALIDAGYAVHVELSPLRIFKDEEFEAVGAKLVPEGSWVDAPPTSLIIGLKELPDGDEFPLHHTHIQFAHCYKQQAGWTRTLSRFARGGGTLYDLEFLTDQTGRRVAAFGYQAGYCGAALAIINWSHQLLHPSKPLPSVSSYPNEVALVTDVKRALAEALPKNAGIVPQVLIIGALGRCGKGAVDLCTAVDLPPSSILRWDMKETASGGPFKEIIESDVFINCIYLTEPIPPFVTLETLSNPFRKLSVVCDVSCDPSNPYNPVPIYNDWTTFNNPTLPVALEGGPPLSVIAIGMSCYNDLPTHMLITRA